MTTASSSRALRVRPWPVDPTTAHVVPYATRRIQPDALQNVLAELADAGYQRVRTAALSPDEQGPFEYACSEGNYGLRNILTAARAEEAEIKAAAARGIVKAPSAQDPDEGEK